MPQIGPGSGSNAVVTDLRSGAKESDLLLALALQPGDLKGHQVREQIHHLSQDRGLDLTHNIGLSVGYHALICVHHVHLPAGRFHGQHGASVRRLLKTLVDYFPQYGVN